MIVLHLPLRRYIYQLRDFQRDCPAHINIVVLPFDGSIAAVGFQLVPLDFIQRPLVAFDFST